MVMGQARGCLKVAVSHRERRRSLRPAGAGQVESRDRLWRGAAAAGASGDHSDSASDALPGMIGDAPVIWRLARLVRKVAPLPLPVLIRGESGSGKELVASALHQCGPRRDGPFVAINRAAVLDTLGASVLFGHVRGAFTGAATGRQGAFRQADGGTLFLDEIAALSGQVQAALLRVVEDGMVQPMGDDRAVPVAVRLVHLAILGGLPAFMLWRELFQRLRNIPDEGGLAVLVERAHPELHELLVSAV
ncbi:MAG: hypothetical protein DRI90_20235, partial [Deltaproteobacteria bacterium]